MWLSFPTGCGGKDNHSQAGGGKDNHVAGIGGVGGVWEDLQMQRSAGSELLSMMGLVAAVVAIVILVFFGVGYLFGRLFL